MLKITCPKCGSHDIIFGKEFAQYFYWYQEEDGTFFCNYELGDDKAELEEEPIECTCNNCNHFWNIKASIYDYLDG